MASDTGSTPRPSPASRPSTLACQQCRKKHLKCDGRSPVCVRCARQGSPCTYTPSRRGYRGNRGRSTEHHETPSRLRKDQQLKNGHTTSEGFALSTSIENTIDAPAATLRQHVETPVFPIGSIEANHGIGEARNEAPRMHPDCPTTPNATSGAHEEFLVNIYYSHFHPTHPFLVPRSRFQAQSYPPYLKLVVHFVGSHFAPTFSSSIQRDTIETTLLAVSDASVHLVQSLLLFAIALHARSERGPAISFLRKATNLAIELGMNRADFAAVHSPQRPLVEESLRRTWWELYVVDGYFAALYRQTAFKCNSVELGAPLPCDESLYAEGVHIPFRLTLDDFDRRFFMDDDTSFSSACYRIGAIRIIARVITVISVGEDAADNIQAVDNALAAWKYHLPHEKAEIIDQYGRFDHMVFQAHMFINCASILLHFSRSELLLNLPTAANTSFSERMTQATPTSNRHAHKAVTASKEISDLAALPIDRHSPLFVCGLAFGCIVQLAVCSTHSHDCMMQHRERVALMTGVLKYIGRVWPIARTVLQQLKRIASGVFHVEPSSTTAVVPPFEHGADLGSGTNHFSWVDFFIHGDSNAPFFLDDEPWEAQPEHLH